MKHYKTILLLLPFLFFQFTSVARSGQNEVLLKSITFHQVSAKDETVRFILSEENTPKIFMLPGDNPRLVVDFFNTECSVHIPTQQKVTGKMIQRIRVGIHPEKSSATRVRVVVDLVPGQDYRYSRQFSPQNNTLLLSIFPKQEKNAQIKTTSPSGVAKKMGGKTPPAVVSKEQVPSANTIGKKAEQEREAEKKLKRINTAQNKIEKQKQEHKKTSPQQVAAAQKQAAGKTLSAKPTKSEVPSEKPKAEAKATKKMAEKENNKIASEKKAESTPSATGKQKALLRSVSFENDARKGEMVLFKLKDFSPPKVKGIEKGEPRVILDFLDTEIGAQVKKNITCNGKYVNFIEVLPKSKPDAVRVVLHLVPHHNYDLQQVFFKDDNLFVIIVNSEEPLLKENTQPSSKI
jgi:hypothetical protein